MDRPRPQLLTVMAILNFVFGALFIMCGLCGAISTIGGPALLQGLAKAAPPGPGGGTNPLADMGGMFDAVPGYYPVNICSALLSIMLNIVLIAAGVGLLKMQPWSRWACVGYAVAVIGLQIVMFVYTVAIVQPAMDKWLRDFIARQGQGAPPPNVGGMAGNIAGSCFSVVMACAYPVALLVVMLLPTAGGAAFAAARESEPQDPFRR